ncbi:hypothetical protein [Flavobacterium luteum]|uniref:Uncharacterized protein n=1 Tax=Flavobacterium luteum TaxID=2026654 RepID=A0A7J5AJJ0_9FLAO|nr:hypothetical protein [Flavobacterium luteum]KAB1157754.1 hypothetical protein F6464_01330 [Flavobacterium luteum]
MKTFFSRIYSSFVTCDWYQSIKKNKWFFVTWFALTLILGLIGVWLPIINDLSNENQVIIGKILINGSLSTYSIVILIDGVINVISTPKFKKSNFLIALIVITFLILIFNIFFYTKIIDKVETRFIKYMTFCLGLISTFIAIYMYKYKKIDPEEGADAVIDYDNERVIESSKNETENPIL